MYGCTGSVRGTKTSSTNKKTCPDFVAARTTRYRNSVDFFNLNKK